MSNHRLLRVLARPRDYWPELAIATLVAGCLVFLGLTTLHTAKKADNAVNVVRTTQVEVVKSFCSQGITPACERKAFTLIRGCLDYNPCRALLVHPRLAASAIRGERNQAGSPSADTVEAQTTKTRRSESKTGPPATSTESTSPAPTVTESTPTTPSGGGGDHTTHPTGQPHQSTPESASEGNGGTSGSGGATTTATTAPATGSETKVPESTAPEASVVSPEAPAVHLPEGVEKALEPVTAPLEPVIKPVCEIAVLGHPVC